MITLFFGWEGPIRWELNMKTHILEINGCGFLPDFNPVLGSLPRWAYLQDQVREVRIGEGVAGIGDYGFYPHDHWIYAKRHPRLERVTFPSTLEFIGSSAFRANTRLRSIDLSNLKFLREIDQYAFSFCTMAK